MDEERAEWSVELNKMQQSLEKQIEESASRRAAAVGAIADGAPNQEEQPVDVGVVGSVMAQFDNVRRQRAQRREKQRKDSA
jgi:hypothetical protein